jgi:chemotaxis protein methyltransferase CheR
MGTETNLLNPAAESAEMPTDPILFRIRDIIYQIAGIYQPENKMYLLANRCSRRIKAVGARDSKEYLEHLTTRANRDAELRMLLNEITIGETCLFRNMPQLDALRKIVLPQLIAAKQKAGFSRLRIWSAGCSTGEEPHTLAMIALEESKALLKGWKVEIVATDLNDRFLEVAKQGLYGDYAVRNTPDYYKRKYFQPKGDSLQANEEVRSLIAFSRLNLQDDSKMLFMKGMDIVFCCNVLIYFDGVSKGRVIQHFFNCLLTGGYFFLGNSESLYRINDAFHLVHFPGATAYLKPAAPVPGAVSK